MSEIQVLKPQKTWSHLAARRRKPSEYEIVSTNLHYNDKRPDSPYELSPDMFMNTWYKKHTFGTALKHADWNAFRDPDEVVYRTYNLMQETARKPTFSACSTSSTSGSTTRPSTRAGPARWPACTPRPATCSTPCRWPPPTSGRCRRPAP